MLADYFLINTKNKEKNTCKSQVLQIEEKKERYAFLFFFLG